MVRFYFPNVPVSVEKSPSSFSQERLAQQLKLVFEMGLSVVYDSREGLIIPEIQPGEVLSYYNSLDGQVCRISHCLYVPQPQN